jgi:hypothetical protein
MGPDYPTPAAFIAAIGRAEYERRLDVLNASPPMLVNGRPCYPPEALARALGVPAATVERWMNSSQVAMVNPELS